MCQILSLPVQSLTIEHQTQAVPNGCVAACLAMLLDRDVEEITAQFHRGYMGGAVEAHDFLREHGLNVRLCVSNEPMYWNKVYMISVPSLNRVATMHAVIIDMRGDTMRVLDPQQGVPGKRYYVAPPSADYSFDSPRPVGLPDEAEPLLGYVVDFEVIV